MKCRSCGEELLREDFRQLRKQKNGVCKACEFKEQFERAARAGDARKLLKFRTKYERELRAQERRADAFFAHVRECRLHVLPDDL